AARVVHGAAVGFQVAGDHVQEGGLPRAVAADQRDHRPFVDAHVEAVGGDHRAEALRQSARLEHGAHAARLRNSDHSPAGRNMITASIAKPSTSCQVYGVYWYAKLLIHSK